MLRERAVTIFVAKDDLNLKEKALMFEEGWVCMVEIYLLVACLQLDIIIYH